MMSPLRNRGAADDDGPVASLHAGAAPGPSLRHQETFICRADTQRAARLRADQRERQGGDAQQWMAVASVWISSGATRLTTLIGMAKPTPSFRRPTAGWRVDADDLAGELNSGPPELPGLIAASVWIAPPSRSSVGHSAVLLARVAAGADDAFGDRLLQAERRADRDGRFADRDLVRIGQASPVGCDRGSGGPSCPGLPDRPE